MVDDLIDDYIDGLNDNYWLLINNLIIDRIIDLNIDLINDFIIGFNIDLINDLIDWIIWLMFRFMILGVIWSIDLIDDLFLFYFYLGSFCL